MRTRLLLLSLSVLVGVLAGAGAANANTIYPQKAPTFVGPVATGCARGCSLLTGPFTAASTASASSSSTAAAGLEAATALSVAHAMIGPTTGSLAPASLGFGAAQAAPAAPTPDSDSQVSAAGCGLRQHQHLGRRRDRGSGPERGRQRVASYEPPGGHRAARPGPVRGQWLRSRDEQHRRDPGLQHRPAAPIRSDPP